MINFRKPNRLLMTDVCKMCLQHENSHFGINDIKSGSFINGCEIIVVAENDLDGKMFKWIHDIDV